MSDMHSTRPMAILLASCGILALSCSRSTEAVSREDQERIFRGVFRFDPPKDVLEIRYSDRYERYLVDGQWGRWMRFTYTEEVLSRILKDGGYRELRESEGAPEKSEPAPEWWQADQRIKATIYTKESPKDRGYYSREYLWRDPIGGFVYWHARYSG